MTSFTKGFQQSLQEARETASAYEKLVELGTIFDEHAKFAKKPFTFTLAGHEYANDDFLVEYCFCPNEYSATENPYMHQLATALEQTMKTSQDEANRVFATLLLLIEYTSEVASMYRKKCRVADKNGLYSPVVSFFADEFKKATASFINHG